MVCITVQYVYMWGVSWCSMCMCGMYHSAVYVGCITVQYVCGVYHGAVCVWGVSRCSMCVWGGVYHGAVSVGCITVQYVCGEECIMVRYECVFTHIYDWQGTHTQRYCSLLFNTL